MCYIKKLCLTFFCLVPMSSWAQSEFHDSTVKEIEMELPTYSYSDPREYADVGRMYPYHRFDGYSREASIEKWKMIEMENDFIKVWIAPSIGGKVWRALDKKTGKDFLYFNHVVKFRDVATRGPWTSGGLEMNFGIIGHSPWCSSQVDYVLDQEDDGTVSCTIGGKDLSLGTDWRVKISLPKDEACLETAVLWYNDTDGDKPFYQWMNAGIKTAGNLQYYFPGNQYLTHDGQSMSWPEEKGHDISKYEENDFGHYKSYHVVGSVTDFWGAWWQDEDFGMAHVVPYHDKLGKKIWIWGLSRYGMVWEDLLTDFDGQYSEVQSGKLFNQSIGTSYTTPFKHFSFTPGTMYSWKEYWMPVSKIGGLDICSRDLACHWGNENKDLNIYAITDLEGKELEICSGSQVVYAGQLHLHPSENTTILFPECVNTEDICIKLEGEVIWSSVMNQQDLSRPNELLGKFDYDSAYGQYIQGWEFEKQNFWDKAIPFYLQSLEVEPMFEPALVNLAGIYYQQNRINEAENLVRKALSVNTYAPKANYLYAQISMANGKVADAVDGYSVAAVSPSYSSLAYQKLASIYWQQGAYRKADESIEKSLEINPSNIGAIQTKISFLRYSSRYEEALELIDQLLEMDRLNYYALYEKYLISNEERDLNYLKSLIINEYKAETFNSLSLAYQQNGWYAEALQLIEEAPSDVVLTYRKAWLLHLNSQEESAQEVLNQAENMSPSLVFPHQKEDEKMYRWALEKQSSSWKVKYYLGLLLLYLDRNEEAEVLFNQCAQNSDFYAFYLVRGNYLSYNESDYLKAVQLEPNKFQCYIELAKYYISKENYVDAVATLESYRKRDKDNSYINLLLADAYQKIGAFQKAVNLMKSIVVLPNEGSLAGRNVWRECNLAYVVSLIEKGKTRNAKDYISNARIWPENLGVGKPYPDSNDERLEDLLSWGIALKSGKGTESLIQHIASYPLNMQPKAISNLFTLWALCASDQKDQADIMLDEWGKIASDSQAYLLGSALYKGDWQTARKIAMTDFPKREALPFEVLFDDRDLDFIIHHYDFFEVLFKQIVATI